MKIGETVKLIIDDLNNNGQGVVRLGSSRFVVFVPDALPNEEVTCRIVQRKRNYAVAEVIKRETDSPMRVKPRCLSFGSCGGCQLQHIDYESQLKLKRQSVLDAIERIGGILDPEVKKCIPSPNEWHYRNKVTLPAQSSQNGKIIIGYYKRGSHKIVPFQHCLVLLKKLEKNTQTLISELKNNNFRGRNPNKSNVIDFIRHIVLREAEFSESNLSAIIGCRKPQKEEYSKLQQISNNNSKDFRGIQFNKNSAKGNFIWGDDFSSIAGKALMEETLGEFKFKFEISSFFQINSRQAINIYEYATSFICESAEENVLELYSGVGTLTAFLSRKAKHVTAVEDWPQASKYLNINMKLNEIKNVTSFAGKAEDISESLSHKEYDTVVLDPPRSGCDKRVVKSIIKIAPKKIIYVSCAPATLARDIKDFSSSGYTLESVQPFDMFPQTGHVECCALIVQK